MSKQAEVTYEEYKGFVKRLEEYGKEEGSELGDAIAVLITLIGVSSYLGEGLDQVLYQEAKRLVEWFDENTEWVEKEYTPPPKTIKIRTLVFKDEEE